MQDPYVYSLILCLKLALLASYALFYSLPRLPFANIYNGAVCLLLLFISSSSSFISIISIISGY